MIHFATFNTPLGLMAVSKNEHGVCRVMFPEAHPFETSLKELYPDEIIVESRVALRDARRQLIEYFSGKRTVFNLEFHLPLTPFYKKVLKEVARIPYGKTVSYKEIAERVGNPAAVRAVGGANANNPLPILIPCHRVIAHDGSLGGYGGQPERKAFLLELERAL
ncbi:MAG: methylated-DNA--[protein]-cysteine S-methyltransferase [FCB group bacterium]|nr:methylated-DNA--[protein]-cysteine S-methyltransferase [FCB group bacterium]